MTTLLQSVPIAKPDSPPIRIVLCTFTLVFPVGWAFHMPLKLFLPHPATRMESDEPAPISTWYAAVCIPGLPRSPSSCLQGSPLLYMDGSMAL